MVLLFSFSCFSTYRTLRIVVEPLDKNAPHLAILRLRDANSYKAVKGLREEDFFVADLDGLVGQLAEPRGVRSAGNY